MFVGDDRELKIDTSRTLRESPRKDWREEWDMNTFFKITSPLGISYLDISHLGN